VTNKGYLLTYLLTYPSVRKSNPMIQSRPSSFVLSQPYQSSERLVWYNEKWNTKTSRISHVSNSCNWVMCIHIL